MAFLVVDHRLLGTQASAVVTCGLWSPGSVTVMHRLSCPTACRIFLDQGLNLFPCFGRQILSHWITREVCNDVLQVFCPEYSGLERLIVLVKALCNLKRSK